MTREDEEVWLQTAIELTQEALHDENVWAIYEATVNVGGTFTTRADILTRAHKETWNMIEVKSIMSKREYDYVIDMAYTTAVLRNAGIDVARVGLMRIDDDFVLDELEQLETMDIFDLMQISWKWQESVEQQINSFNASNAWNFIDHLTASPAPPPANFSLQCQKCPSCRRFDNCATVLELPNLGHMQDRYFELMEAGIHCIQDIPDGFFSTRNSYEQTAAIVTSCVKQGKMYVSDMLQELLSTHFNGPAHVALQRGPIIWPVLYLDFETLSTAVPLFTGAHPYQNIPIQYSLHRASYKPVVTDLFAPDLETVEHREMLADPSLDQRKELALKLLNDIDQLSDPQAPNSSIMAYHASVEKNAIEYLASLFVEDQPEIANRLYAITLRLVDLLKIIKGGGERQPRAPNFYHPAFKGKFGLKSVIKIFSQEYENLDIKSGDAALAAYGQLAYALKFPLTPWDISEFDQTKILTDLAAYCQLDTYSMIQIHSNLVMIAVQCPSCLHRGDIVFNQDQVFCTKCQAMIKSDMMERSHNLYCPGRKKVAG